MPGRRYCASTKKKKKLKSVVRVCEFVDRVSQIRVLGYFSLLFIFLFFFSPLFFLLFFSILYCVAHFMD